MFINFAYQNLAVLCMNRPWNGFRFSWKFYYCTRSKGNSRWNIRWIASLLFVYNACETKAWIRRNFPLVLNGFKDIALKTLYIVYFYMKIACIACNNPPEKCKVWKRNCYTNHEQIFMSMLLQNYGIFDHAVFQIYITLRY